MDGLSWTILWLSAAAAAFSVWEIWLRRIEKDAAWKAACVSAVFNLLVAVLAFISGQWAAAEAAESKAQIAKANSKAEGARAEAETAKADSAKANAGLAKANLEIENRKQENLKLSQDLQRESAARLVLEEAVAPRGIEQAKSAEALRNFAGTKVKIVSLDEPEPKTTADQLSAMLEAAGWKIAERRQEDHLDFTGVVVSIAINSTDKEVAKRLDAACRSLTNQLTNKSDVAAMYNMDVGKNTEGDGTLLITVGDIPTKAGLLRRLQQQRQKKSQ